MELDPFHHCNTMLINWQGPKIYITRYFLNIVHNRVKVKLRSAENLSLHKLILLSGDQLWPITVEPIRKLLSNLICDWQLKQL